CPRSASQGGRATPLESRETGSLARSPSNARINCTTLSLFPRPTASFRRARRRRAPALRPRARLRAHRSEVPEHRRQQASVNWETSSLKIATDHRATRVSFGALDDLL